MLAKVRSVKETASTEDGTVAMLSKNVAGGGANSGAYTQIYLLGPDGKRTAVFRDRLDHFNATGLGISGNGKWLALSGRYTEGPSDPSKIWLVRSERHRHARDHQRPGDRRNAGDLARRQARRLLPHP